MKKKSLFFILLIGLSFIFSCTEGSFYPTDTVVQGTACFSNTDDSSGIIIRIEKNDASVRQSLITVTDENGSYSFTGCEPGNYTVYATSNNSSEKTVTANVTIESGRTVTVESLFLTAVGSLKGKILLDGTDDGNLGFIVFIAGTSYLSITDSDGSFTISDIPAGSKNKVLVMKEDFVKHWKVIDVKAFETSDLGTLNVLSSELEAKELPINKPSVPVFSISSGAVDYKDRIELTCDTPDAKIYYSLDNGNTYHKYNYPIEILEDTKITAYSSYILDSDEVTAEYEIKYYKLNYETSGIGKFTSVKNLKKGDKVTLYSNTVRGYDYKWYLDSDFIKEADPVITVYGNVIIYGEFIPKVYKINYELNAAYWKLPPDYPYYHTYGTETVLPVPVAINELSSLFEINGWKESSSGKYYKIIGPEDIASDVIISYDYNQKKPSGCMINGMEYPIGSIWVEDGHLLNQCSEDGEIISVECEYGAIAEADKGMCISPPLCGNRKIEAAEECDDPGNPYCTFMCTLSRCGDGIIQEVLGEECDDPNDPFCSDTCTIIPH